MSDLRSLTIDSAKLVDERQQSFQRVAGSESCGAAACTRSRRKSPSTRVQHNAKKPQLQPSRGGPMKNERLGKNVGNLAIRQFGKGLIWVCGEDSNGGANPMIETVASGYLCGIGRLAGNKARLMSSVLLKLQYRMASPIPERRVGGSSLAR